MEEITQHLYLASQEKCVCRITMEREPFPRLIHPYGIFKTSFNKIMVACWQEAGFTKAGATAGYRNLLLENIDEVEITDKHFLKRDDFNHLDGQYKEWVYHI